MDKIMENVNRIMQDDRKKIVDKNDTEQLYVWEIANKWVEMNVQNKQEFEEKLGALGKILENEKFKKAIEITKTSLRKEFDLNKAQEVAELIKEIKQTDEYIENSKIARYKLLDKYEEPITYKTDSFRVHTNIMTRLYKYLEEKLCQMKEEKYGE